MNEFLELLLARRTVRAFQSEAISQEKLDEILTAAKYAPSAMGLQTRHFTVVRNQELLKKIVAATQNHGGKFVPGHVPFYDAPAVIVLSAPSAFALNREDCACAAMNIMLAAQAQGLASCYICSVIPGLNDEEIRKELKLPDQYVALGCVCIGLADGEIPEPKERRTDDITYIC